MNNPIKIFNEIFDAYFKYINSYPSAEKSITKNVMP